MYISTLEINRIRCFKDLHKINLSKNLNLLVGHNNSGKSTILKSIYQLQGYQFQGSDITVNAESGTTKIDLKTNTDTYNFININYGADFVFDVNAYFEFHKNSATQGKINLSEHSPQGLRKIDISFELYPGTEPNNIIYPFFSNRKVSSYVEAITLEETKRVTGTLSNLYSKIDSIANSSRPVNKLYREACLDILGFYIGTEQSARGKFAAFTVDDNRNIPLTSMGDGIANILGLIVNLCVAKDKIFLIEEPENDIHPKALKGLLRLIEKRSDENQFIISTHSNIVVKQLCAIETTKVFKISSITDYSAQVIIPESTITEVGDSGEERIKLLEDLGYELYDYAIWKGWLFLEESSAEELIREFFIPTFTPNLSYKLRTHSTQGVSEVEAKFKSFNDLFVYIHRDQSYKNRAWVVIDAGDKEQDIIDKLKSYYLKHGWSETNFRQFSFHDFEDFYPTEFSERVQAIKTIEVKGDKRKEKDQRREAKATLLNEVKAWINENPENAKVEFEKSAFEIINLLKEIENALR